MDNLICPISKTRIDRNVVRVSGFITTLLLAAYVATGSAWIVVPVGLDYALRTPMNGPRTPLGRLAGLIAKSVGLPYRAMDKAPKVFASRIGVCFAMGAAIAHFEAPSMAPWLAGTLAVFTCLESVFDFCVGCIVYTYIALPMYRAREAVSRIPLFQGLSDALLVAVSAGFERTSFDEGTRIVTEGEPGDAMYVLLRGRVEVYHEGEDGQRNVVNTHAPRTWFGEMALLGDQPRVAHVRAATPVSALRLERRYFDRLMEKHPDMRDRMERTATERLAHVAALETA